MAELLVKHINYEDTNEFNYACPICGDPPDYCQDHNHWLCGRCGSPFEIEENEKGQEIWECPQCFQNPMFSNIQFNDPEMEANP